jgi:plastocyanin
MFSILFGILFSVTVMVVTNSGFAYAQLGENGTKSVHAGNDSSVSVPFEPQNIEIKAGESVTWDNPTSVAEPHTVTFVLDKNTLTGLASPFAVSNTTEFKAIPPGSNNEPILLPGNMSSDGEEKTIIAINSRIFNPTTIDSQGKVNFMNPNTNYRFGGDERFVNSGWLLPKGLEKVYPGSGNTFTATFEKSGTYEYLCVLHPWMTGSVIVK